MAGRPERSPTGSSWDEGCDERAKYVFQCRVNLLLGRSQLLEGVGVGAAGAAHGARRLGATGAGAERVPGTRPVALGLMLGKVLAKFVDAVAIDIAESTAAGVKGGVGHTADIVAASELEPFTSGDVHRIE